MKIKTSLNTTERETHSYTCYKKHLNANTYTQLFDFSMSATYWGSRGPSSSWCSWVSGFANKPLKTLTSTKRNCDHWMHPNSANVFVYDCIQPISLCSDSNSKHMLFLVYICLCMCSDSTNPVSWWSRGSWLTCFTSLPCQTWRAIQSTWSRRARRTW